MKFGTFALATSTALVLSMTTAFADENLTDLDQDGSDNVATVNQNGVDNTAGNSDAAVAMRQLGDANLLTIDQTGEGNTIGLGSNADITGAIGPFVPAAAANGLLQQNMSTVTRNTASITQEGDNNALGALYQGAIQGAQQGANSLAITQDGDNNAFASVTQVATERSDNSLDATVTGSGNVLQRIVQFNDASTAGSAGDLPNQLSIDITGDNNGVGSFSGGAAGLVGAVSSEIVQGRLGSAASDSNANILIVASGNKFGVTQLGTGNDVGTLEITGNENEVGTYQDGDSNTITLAPVSGTLNSIGFEQSGGDGNIANASVIGSRNDALTRQIGFTNDTLLNINGDDNSTDVLQLGNLNVAQLDVIGNFNTTLVSQTGDSHLSESMQDGNNNSLTVMQTANANASFVSQVGDNNMAAVYQN